MRKLLAIIIPVVAMLALAACSDDAPADKMTGTYPCEAYLSTRYMKDGKWRDTSYVSKQDNNVVISKIDDETVAVRAHCKKWGDAKIDRAPISDFSYQGNFSGIDTFVTASGARYLADISGTVSYDSHSISLSIRVNNYPNSGGKYILSLTRYNY